MERLIVIKGQSNFNPELGIVIPVAIEHEDGSYKSVSLDEFPNLGIFISKDYRKIEDTFKEDELFILREWHETDKEWQDNKRHQKYYAIGDWAERLEHNILIPAQS